MEDSFDVWDKGKKTVIQMPCEPRPVSETPWGSHHAVGQIFVVLLECGVIAPSCPLWFGMVMQFALSNKQVLIMGGNFKIHCLVHIFSSFSLSQY